MDVTSLTNLYHLLYSGLILKNFLPMQLGGSSRRRLLEEEILSPNFGAACEALFLLRTSPEAYDLLAVVPSFSSLKDRLDCSYLERLLVPLPRRICQYGMSPWFSLCTKPLLSLLVYYSILLFQLSGSSSEAIVDTF